MRRLDRTCNKGPFSLLSVTLCNIVLHRPFRPDATQCYRILRRSKNRPCVTGALARPIRPCFHPHGWPGAPAILICWAEEPCSGWIEAGLAAWRGGEVLDLLAGLAGEELAHGRYQRLDALAQALVALARALVRRTGLLGQGQLRRWSRSRERWSAARDSSARASIRAPRRSSISATWTVSLLRFTATSSMWRCVPRHRLRNSSRSLRRSSARP